MDADRHGPDRTDPERAEDEHPRRPHRTIRLSGLHFRATVLVENRKTLHRRQPLKEEPEAISDKRSFAAASAGNGTMGTSSYSPQRQVAGMAELLLLWDRGSDVFKSESLRLRSSSPLPSSPSHDDAFAGDAPILAGVRLRQIGRPLAAAGSVTFCVCTCRSLSESRMREFRTSGLMSGGWETGDCQSVSHRAHPRLYPRPHPPHEQRKSGLGSAAHSRRVAEARHQHRRDQREQVSGPEPEAAVPDMADFPREPSEEPCVRRLLYRADDPVSGPLRLPRAGARASAHPSLRGHGTSDCRVDCTAAPGSFSVGQRATLSAARPGSHLRA